MLTISTIPEALIELEKQTDRAWTESEIFDVATKCRIDIHAAPPITAQTKIQEFVIGKGLVEKFSMPPGHSALALLFPAQVGQLWISNETETSHPSDHDARDGEYKWFTEPIKVTREQVRIKSQSLKKILAIWSRAQTGKEPRHRAPEWMFPLEQEKQNSKKSIMNTDTQFTVSCSESLIVRIDVGDGTLRDALPVRAIPYVTGWDGDFGVPPWEVTIRLQTNINLHAWDISAFRVLDGKPVAVQPRQWVMVATQLSGLSEKLHRQYPRNEHIKPSAEGVAEWQSEAAEKLPARAFVWLDELKAEYHGWFGTKFKSRPNLAIPEFDLTPLLSEQVRKMVLEGFEQPSIAIHPAAENVIEEISNVKAEIQRWETKDESLPSETLIKKRELQKLRTSLAELEEKKRVERGDIVEFKPKIAADFSLQDGETGKIEVQNESENYQLLWSAVRNHEAQVSESIEELRGFKATTITEVATRDEKLAAWHVELAQIIRRKDMLVSIVDFNVNRAAETRYVIEEMTKSRPGAIPIDKTRRAAQIKDANEEIDALIASNTSTSSTMQNGSASGGEQVGDAGASDKKPWMQIAPSDPKAMQPWYIPARYFARQLVIEDSTLLVKRLILADKVAISLSNVGIYKRGGKKKRHDAATILKAFANVTLG